MGFHNGIIVSLLLCSLTGRVVCNSLHCFIFVTQSGRSRGFGFVYYDLLDDAVEVSMQHAVVDPLCFCALLSMC